MEEKRRADKGFSSDEKAEGPSDRSFGLVFTAVFALIGLWPLLNGGTARIWALAVSVIFLVVSFARPAILAPLNRLWMRFGELLHKIVNPIVMGLMFFCAVTPTGLIMRAMGKDLLHLKKDPAAKSYWIERQPPGPAPESMKHQF
ncbi:MAG: hypothetical protein HOO00_05855 [Rhodospirillaceae bacterium]|jgi:hypothetical protein|nr:hypothetical protein [Rhodospirillaceae bacterium]MBT5374875.1 hypothetical protein [Rhodospirillaceae bacterium]MBT5660387.1 hypothetical protein [Rhodospirillaceae bacterium]MBT5751561.1 hypothetical protein [Rhodospirillaceae bacterium]